MELTNEEKHLIIYSLKQTKSVVNKDIFNSTENGIFLAEETKQIPDQIDKLIHKVETSK